MNRYSWNRWTFSIATVIAAVAPGCSALPGDASEETEEDVGETQQALAGYTLTNVPASPEFGTDVSVDFLAPANHSAFDWVSLRRVGAPFYEYLSYQYVAGAQGSLTFSLNATVVGESYEFQYYLDNGYEIAATSSSFTVQAAIPVYGLSNGPSMVSPGGTANISWTAPANHSTFDWVGLFVAGTPAEQFVDFYYLDVSGSTSGVASVLVPVDAVAGASYELRLYLDDFFVLAASSPSFMIGSGLTVSSEPVRPGAQISASWTATASHSVTDWVGLYEVGAPSSPAMAWTYVGTPGAGSGSVSIPIPGGAQVHSSCELRYFSNNSYNLVGRSTDFLIANTISVADETIMPGGSVTASWVTPSSHSPLDWVGIYEVGAPNSAQQGWVYVEAGASSGNSVLVLPASATVGQPYELRYFLNQTYELGSRSNPFIAGPPLHSVVGPSGSVSAGNSLQVSWGAPASHSDLDWIGLHMIGSSPQDVTSYSYVVAPGASSGSVSINVPAGTVPGSYEVRYYINNGYSVKATSAAFQVD